MNSNLVDTYLYYSYIHKCNAEILNHDFWRNRPVKNSYTIMETAGRFDKIFDQLLNENSSTKHIVPLSGGWDSRAILGALCERINNNEIETVTFGVPGQLDYDIGLMIGKKTGVKFNSFDLRLIDFNWEAIIKSVKISPWTYVPDGLFNQASIDFVVKKNGLIWSGFLGDPITGSHLNSAIKDYSEFTDIFVKKQQRCTSLFLPSVNYKPVLPENFDPDNMNYRHDDYLDLVVRQANCIAPIVLFQNIDRLDITSFDYKNDIKVVVPFSEKNWIRYWLDAPESYRCEQRLYLDMLNYKFPKLFALPSKQDLGLPRNALIRKFLAKGKHFVKTKIQKKYPYLKIRSSINLNYLDYDQMYRRRKDYKETLITAFDYLKSNEIALWLNYDKLWNEHMRNQKNYGDAFNVLVGLAANLKVSKDDVDQ